VARQGTGRHRILLVLLCVVCTLPALLAPRIARAHNFQLAVLRGLRFSPPFAAAALVSHRPGSHAIQFGLLLAWMAGLLLILAAIERQAARPRSVAQAEVTWHDLYQRVALLFGPAMAPLVGRSLRYYLRCNKVRFNYILAIPILAFVTFAHRQEAAQGDYLMRGLGTFAIVGLLGTAVLSTNQFGFDASGFRRYFLLPIPPAAILRASSYTSLFLGGTLVLLALLLWMLFAPVPPDPRIPLMLLASGAGGSFLFNALSLWTSLLAPRRTDFNSTFGNQLSLPANVLLIGGVLAGILGGQAVETRVATPAALADGGCGWPAPRSPPPFTSTPCGSAVRSLCAAKRIS
jgi:hypothetical protein